VGERVTEAAAGLARARGEREAARSQQEQREEERRLARQRVAERRSLAASVRREMEDLEHSLLTLRAEIGNARTERGMAETAVGPSHARLAEAQESERELLATRSDSQARLMAAERELVASEAALRERAAQVRAFEQQLADDGLVLAVDGTVRVAPRADVAAGEGGVATLEAGAVIPARGGADVDPGELRETISDLRAQIRALGPVNVDALEDLSEERERHAFLSGQVQDLDAAEQQLRAAIRELRRLIRDRFDETFAQVNQNFGEYFTRFFGGGAAHIEVVQGEDDAEPGVEIHARPPGKRISSLNMLSGGERALTSVALLFALLSVNPAPVCVLDEVDAALDEANVGRFVGTLAELDERSQFIVITHNRRTVESAGTIYGVSMGEDSCSTVLSLRLADLPAAS
jgi:chromosome segregation protein